MRALRVGAGLLLALLISVGAWAQESKAQKVLRLSFPTAETGFDPAQVNDLYARTVTPHIFEGRY